MGEYSLPPPSDMEVTDEGDKGLNVALMDTTSRAGENNKVIQNANQPERKAAAREVGRKPAAGRKESQGQEPVTGASKVPEQVTKEAEEARKEDKDVECARGRLSNLRVGGNGQGLLLASALVEEMLPILKSGRRRRS